MDPRTLSLLLVMLLLPITAVPVGGVPDGRAGPDIRPGWLEFDPVIEAWEGPGAGASLTVVGRPTAVQLHVMNDGDLDASDVDVTITVMDIHNNVMDKHSETLPRVNATNETLMVWDAWTPQYSTRIHFKVVTNTTGDTDTGNDISYYYGDWIVAKWYDDAGPTSEGNFTGDIGPAVWHVTATVDGDLQPYMHTAPYAWYLGSEGGPLGDHYTSPLNISIVSPVIDLSGMNPSYPAFLDLKYYGETHPQDPLKVLISDDGGTTWYDPRVSISGVTNTTNPLTGQPNWQWRIDNTADLDGNGQLESGEYDVGMDISEYIGEKIQFQLLFDTTTNLWVGQGLYIDDMWVYGIEDQREVYVGGIDNIGVTRLGDIETISADIVNSGSHDMTGMTVRLDVYDGKDQLLENHITTVSVKAGKTARTEWDWTPDEIGDHRIKVSIVTTDEFDDSLSNNEMSLRAHVSDGNATVLVVDDDNGPTNCGGRLHIKGHPDLDLDDELTDALGVSHDVYRVGPGQDGPSLDLMEGYATVVWLTGYDGMGRSKQGTLSASDRAGIAELLGNDGSLWLISPEVLYDLETAPGYAMTWLKVGDFNDDLGTPDFVDGVDGHPVGDGLSMETAVPNPGIDKADSVTTTGGSHGVLFATDTSHGPTGPYNTIGYNDSYKLLFTSFEFSYIKDPGERRELASRALDWLYTGVLIGYDDATKEIDADGSVTYTGLIENRGTSERRLKDLEVVDGPDGWKASITPEVTDGEPYITIPGGGAMGFSLNVTAKEGEAADFVGETVVGLTMEGDAFTVTGSTYSTVRKTAGVRLALVNDVLKGSVGDNVTFLLYVNNSGNVEEFINMSAEGEAAQWTDYDEAFFPLRPLKSESVVATVSVPMDAEARPHEVVLVARASSGESARTVKITATVQVKQFRSLEILEVGISDAGRVDPASNDPTATVTAEVRNNGNGHDNVTVGIFGQFEDAPNWTLPTVKRTLLPFERKVPIDLVIRAGNDTLGGAYNLTVEVKSDADDGVYYRSYISVHVQRADLTLSPSDIEVPEFPIAGETNDLRIKVRNKGDSKVDGFSMTVGLDYASGGGTVFQGTVDRNIDPASSTTVEIEWIPMEVGSFNMTVSLDGPNEVIEHDEGDNTAVRPVSIYKPDLSVKEGSIRFNVEGEWVNGTTEKNSVAVFIDIANTHPYSYEARRISVKVLVDGTQFDTTTITVEARTTYTWLVEWEAEKGEHTFTVIIDEDGELDELSEDNNEAGATITVTGAGTAQDGVAAQAPIVALVVVVALVVAVFAYMRSPASPLRNGRVVTAVKKIRCKECRGPIKRGEDYYLCKCGRRIHSECADDVGICECLRRIDI